MTTHVQTPETLLDLLTRRAEHAPDKSAYTFLMDGETQEITKTNHELDTCARIIAAHLHRMTHPGERALLLYPSGLDYISAFFGCLYADVVAVPCSPPRRHRPDFRLQTIAKDAQATVILTNTRIFSDRSVHTTRNPSLHDMTWLATDQLTDVTANQWTPGDIDRNTLAFLQYTSGSTGTPKGVMVTHGNLLHNAGYIIRKTHLTSDTIGLTWLPVFHDMGLMNALIAPLAAGFQSILMAPEAFLQHPLRWLRAISRYRVTYSGGPNFAYALCVHHVRPVVYTPPAQQELRKA